MKKISKTLVIGLLFLGIGIFCVNAQTYFLNVIPSGNGTVTGTGMYSAGTNVTITATPASGWVFTGWTGSITSSSNPYTVTVYSAMTINANFSQSGSASQWTSNGNSIYYMGGVGIGTNTVNYKLTVAGDIYANGGWLRTSGNAGWYSESYGGGFYMVDGTWIRTYGNKNFYHNTGIMRTDGSFQVGPDGNRFIVNDNGNVGIGITNFTNNNNFEVAGTTWLHNHTVIKGNTNSDMLDITNNQTSVNGDYDLIAGSYDWGGDQPNNPRLMTLYGPNGATRFMVKNNGQVGIGIDPGNSTSILTVNGKMDLTELEVKQVAANILNIKQGNWADDVFAKDYKLMSLIELEKYININQHLPNVPTETEVKKNGINVGDMNSTLLRKIEELTKYVLELNKKIEELQIKVNLNDNK